MERGPDGQPLASPEDVVVTMKPKKDGEPTNITVRGVTPRAFEVRGGIKMVEGRMFTPGLYEVIVGDKIAKRVQGLDIGSSVKLQKHEWTVVGIFSSQGGAFESEIWGDQEVMGVDFGRTGGSNALSVRLKPGTDVADPRPLDPLEPADAAPGGVGAEVLRRPGGARWPRSCASSPPSWPSSWAWARSSGP